MRGHEHGTEVESYRPKGDRVEATPDHDLMGQAAAQGRPDVLGASGLLGLQRVVGNAGVGSLMEEERSSVYDVVGSGGSALDAETRTDMEARFGGESFSDVRVHTDGKAHESAKSMSAQAYTVGSDIVFQSGKYDPGSDAGKHMLAHELTHVVQQRNGPVEGTDVGGGVKVSDPSDRFEREASANADRLMAAPVAAPAGAGAGAPASASASAQRCAEDHDHAVHGGGGASGVAQESVQRAEEEEAPEEGAQGVAQTYVQREGDEDEAPEESAG